MSRLCARGTEAVKTAVPPEARRLGRTLRLGAGSASRGRSGEFGRHGEVAAHELVAQLPERLEALPVPRARLPRVPRCLVVPVGDRGEPLRVVLRAEQPGRTEA